MVEKMAGWFVCVLSLLTAMLSQGCIGIESGDIQANKGVYGRTRECMVDW